MAKTQLAIYCWEMSRFVGRSGEKRFSTLCSDAGITCNEPREDDHGWDHIIEFPHRSVPGVSADLQQPIPPIFVQTKSHEAHGLTVQMKLSNAIKLARSPSPCFVVLVVLAPGRTETSWYVAHFWENLIGRTLQRAREASRDGIPEEEFHNHSFSFTMTENDVLDQGAVLSWIEEAVRRVGPDYAAAKRQLHSDIALVGTIQFGPLLSIEDLVDHQLGLTPSIPMKSITFNTRRFDIDIPFPLQLGQPNFASMHVHPVDQCDVRLRGPDNFTIELTGDVLVPAIPNIEGNWRKVRLRTFLLDILWSEAESIDITVHLKPQERRTPKEIEQVIYLASWSGEGAIDVRVNVRDQRLLAGSAHIEPLPAQSHYKFLTGPISSLVLVSSHLKSHAPQISVKEVADSEWVVPFHHFLIAKDMNFRVSVSGDPAIDSLHSGIAGAVAQIGEWLFAALQRFPVLEYSYEEGVLQVKFGQPVLIETYAFHLSDEAALKHMQSDYERLSSAPGIIGLDNVLLALRKNAEGPTA